LFEQTRLKPVWFGLLGPRWATQPWLPGQRNAAGELPGGQQDHSDVEWPAVTDHGDWW
jgi:hypothetical protein